MYKKTVLDNGLRVISHALPARQSAAVGVWITIGGRYEHARIKGISHFLEHMLFKGSRKYSCRGIKESIEGVGGALNGFTSEELTCYLAKIPAARSGIALDVLTDMVLHPRLDPKEVKKERTVILEEIKMYRDLPQSYVHELLDKLLWPGQPLGEPIIGTHESVTGITRGALSDFKEAHYVPANIVVSACGAVDHERIVKAARAKFARSFGRSGTVFSAARQDQDEPRLNILDKNTEQTHLALGFHSLRRDDPLRHALGILHIIMGANMSSRLFEQVRERRGLAYEIGTQVKRFRDTGAFIVHAGIEHGKVAPALALILKELKKVAAAGVTADEFRRGREFYRGQLMLALEDTLDHMLWIGESLAVLGRARQLNEIIAEVKRVSRDDVLKVARQIFNTRNLNVALIGPLESRRACLARIINS